MQKKPLKKQVYKNVKNIYDSLTSRHKITVDGLQTVKINQSIGPFNSFYLFIFSIQQLSTEGWSYDLFNERNHAWTKWKINRSLWLLSDSLHHLVWCCPCSIYKSGNIGTQKMLWNLQIIALTSGTTYKCSILSNHSEIQLYIWIYHWNKEMNWHRGFTLLIEPDVAM